MDATFPTTFDHDCSLRSKESPCSTSAISILRFTSLRNRRWRLDLHPTIAQCLALLHVEFLWEWDKQLKQTCNSHAFSHCWSTGKALNCSHNHRPCSFEQIWHFTGTLFLLTDTWVTVKVLPAQRTFVFCWPKPQTVSKATIQLSASSLTKAWSFLTLPSKGFSPNQSWYFTINCSFTFNYSFERSNENRVIKVVTTKHWRFLDREKRCSLLISDHGT